MASALDLLNAIGTFTILSLLIVLGYHYLYRSSLTVVSKAELEWFVPALVPGLVVAWWLLGVLDSVFYTGAFPIDLWTWWMPAGALLVFGISRRFAVWNRTRLIKRRPRYP